MSVLTGTQQSYAQEQAQEIFDHMSNLKIATHIVVTSERRDRKLHRQFPTIANELRKKGLKVKSKDFWNTTEWTVYL